MTGRWTAGVSPIKHSNRSIGIPLRRLTAERLETHDGSLAVIGRPVGIPPNAKIECETPRDPPVVLNKKTPAHTFQILEFPASLSKRRSAAKHEVGEPVSGKLAVEREVAHRLEAVRDVIRHPNGFTAEAKLVAAEQFRRDLTYREIPAIEITFVTRTDGEPVRDTQIQ